MTVLLTPVETISDDLTIMGLEKHWDDELGCTHCEKRATVRRIMRCCKNWSPLCGPHCAHDIEVVRGWLDEGCPVRCKHCRALYEPPQTTDDIYRVVPL